MKTFIFDLDGTLLPMPSQKKFLDTYLSALCGTVSTYGYDPQKLIQALMAGTGLMLSNDGSMTNQERFWTEFGRIFGSDEQGSIAMEPNQIENIFDDFYRNEFSRAKITTTTHPLANTCIQLLKDKGYQIVLATNPLFPRIATLTRILWAGLDPEDFDHITTYEVSSYCKPNLEYYKEVLKSINRRPEECIMVGNDVTEDMCVSQLGMETFLLKECLISPEGLDITCFKQGDFEDLYQLIQELPVRQE
jgi:FMN phosphatase YigB (HAD superfamily)